MNKNTAFNIFLTIVFLASAFLLARLLITGEGSFRSIEYSREDNPSYYYFDLIFVGILMLLSSAALWASFKRRKNSSSE